MTLAEDRESRESRETVHHLQVPLKEFVLSVLNEREDKYVQKFEALKESLSAVVVSLEKAVLKAEVATEKRFESVNEFRKQMGDMQTTLAPKSEVNMRFDAANARIDVVAKALETIVNLLSNTKGKSEGTASTGTVIVTVVNILLVIAVIVISLLKK